MLCNIIVSTLVAIFGLMVTILDLAFLKGHQLLHIPEESKERERDAMNS